MGHEGFLGSNLGITRMEIRGSHLILDCSFSDDEGRVHATTQHKLVIGEHEHLAGPATALLDAALKHITAIHFRSAHTDEEKATYAGISESLRNAGTPPPEGFEEDG